MSHGAAGAWAPLRHPEFALLWGAALISNIGGWMHDMAAGWLMATLDPTPYMVAMVQAASTLPVCLLALPAGTLADRMDRRRLLLAAQWVMLALALLLGLLVLAGRATAPVLLLVTLGIGACMAVVSPTWQSIVPALVSRDNLQPAIALHSVGINISRAIGPALAGLIIAAFGIAWPSRHRLLRCGGGAVRSKRCQPRANRIWRRCALALCRCGTTRHCAARCGVRPCSSLRPAAIGRCCR
jgi:MFS family permease